MESVLARITTRRACLFFLALYLGGMSPAACQSACPAGCLCHLGQQPRTVMCSWQGMEQLPENISDIVEHLDLSTNLLTDISSDINRLIDLQYLNLARNHLSSLPADLRSLKNLRRLDLSENRIHDVADVSSVEQLSSLVVLYLSKNPLPTLEGLTSDVLQAVDASHCEMKELGNKSLDGLPALTTLSLAGNPLRSIQKARSQNLRWLDMSDCFLNYLSPDTFSGFPELEELRLANNPTLVYSTRHSTLRHFKLRKLDVSRCDLDRPGLHGFPFLTHARLSHNMIRLLPDRIFAKNRLLVHLYLNSNGIERLNASAFEGLVKLQLLDLSANSLEEIHPLAFQDNVELRLLNLSYNALYAFPNLTTAATTLDLSSNLIQQMEKNVFGNMPKLRSVNLGYNQLQDIPNGLRSSTLMSIDARRNRLVELGNDSFTELPQLLKLDLSGNRLTEAMDPEVFRNNPDLNTIKLEDNPWRCECMDLYVLYSFLTSEPAKTSGSSLICQSPSNVSGYSWEAACFHMWHGPQYRNKERTWGLVLVSLLTMIVVFGSIVSIRHTMLIKRRAVEHREELERAEARERLRLLQRRNQRLDDDFLERPSEPRIHPLELIGPPSYEEAVHMPRLAHSLDRLDEISVDTGSVRVMGSVDNLRPKKRRSRRPRKRTQSEDDLLRRQERRDERIRRERNNSTGNISNSHLPQSAGRSSSARRDRRRSLLEESVDSTSGKGRPRPQTPSAKKRKRRKAATGGHSTDDEDSDVQAVGSSRSVVIRELRREPRSGYRESMVERDS